jgi:hypothetical protein
LGVAEHLIGGEAFVMVRHQLRRDGGPLLDMSASPADAKIDSAIVVPIEKGKRLGLDDLPLTATA